MRILLIGYGKMGQAIETIALERGHTVAGKVNSSTPLSSINPADCDCAIEFTRPELAVDNIKFCADHKIPVIVGTTGWYNEYPTLKEYIETRGSAMLAATNFSLGVNITFYLNRVLASIMNRFPEYACSVTEIHHTQKLDAPSGTAISIAEGIIENHNAYRHYALASENTGDYTLPIEALREGLVPGTHIVKYQSEIDTITLEHEAHNRKGFALGSVLAAEWLAGKQGVFTMQQMLDFSNIALR